MNLPGGAETANTAVGCHFRSIESNQQNKQAAAGTRVMLHLVETQRVYYPETLAAMAAAFDQVCQWLRSVNSDDEARRQLAMIIIRFVDQGEHDPEWLAKYAFCEMIVLGGLLSSARFAEIREAQATRHTQCDFDIDDCAARFSEA